MKKGMVAVAALLVCAFSMQTKAQNVTISPTTGSLMAASTYEGEVGFENGSSSMWKHEQLPLTFTVADQGDLTDGNELSMPAGDMRVENGYLVVHGGARADLYCAVSLPKGYRITGYKMVLLNNLNNVRIAGQMRVAQNKVMYETDKYFNTTNYLARGYYADDENEYTMGTTNSNTREYVVERHSKTESDMGNQIYFHLTHAQNNYFAVTIKSFEIFFTAEGTFDAVAAPIAKGLARSYVTSPFSTSKIDIGVMKPMTKNGQTFFAYDYQNVQDLEANLHIYQDDAVSEAGVPTEGDEVKKIFPVNVDGENQFAFGNGTYYVEPPVTVHTSSGWDSPIGFRVVGAEFNYKWGTATDGGTQTHADGYYIRATRNNRTYYLDHTLQFTRTPVTWSYDEETKELYYVSGNTNKYLSCSGDGDTRTLSTSIKRGNWYNLIVFTRGGTTYVGWDNETTSKRYYLRYYDDDDSWFGENWVASVTRANTSGAATAQPVGTPYTYELPDYAPGAYKLKVYGTDKVTPVKTITVNSASDAGGTITLDSLNNDAVKFEVTGLPKGTQALVNVTLKLQALNPYIDKMDIVCHDPHDQLTLSQPFTASNFMVSGGKFTFYIPEDYSDTELSFTFSDLYSHDGDKTYYAGTADQKNGNARYSFVTSDYFYPINGNGNDGLYDNAYKPDAEYTNKVFTSTAGNIRFRFNNADELGNESGTTTEKSFTEYPFSVEAYLASTDPDAASGGAPGAFNEVKLKASDDTQKSGTYYVFTADETRYNIAPTKAWQHRYYAFYRMEIELKAKSYTPDLKWKKVYDEGQTLYMDNDGKAASKSQWGLKLGTTDNGNVVTGYLTVKEINDAIAEQIADETIATPESADQILYIDASELYSIVSSANITLDQLKNTLGANALFYLPANTTSTLDNFAYKTTSGSFHAGKDIVLTDKKPFYAPYDIQVNTANVAKFTRDVTVDKYGKTDYISMILPFNLTLTSEEGSEQKVHVNTTDDGCKFALYQMNASGCVSIDENHKGYNYFSEEGISKQTAFNYEVAPANTPFLVDVKQGSNEDGKILVVTQTGASIKATSAMGSDYTFTGETGNGTYMGNAISFVNHGSFAGNVLNVPNKTEGYYYIGSANKLVCSDDLKSTITTVKLLPFRSYYTSTKSGSNSNRLMQMNIVFGKNEQGDQTGIKQIETIKENGAVYDLQGRRVENPTKGLYIVNGKKVMVK